MDRKIFLYSIVASILASAVFLWALEPFAHWVLQTATDTAGAWRTNLQNQAFSNASLGNREWLLVVLYLLGLLSLAGLIIGVGTAFVLRWVAKNKRIAPMVEGTREWFPKSLAKLTLGAVLFYCLGRILITLTEVGFFAYVDLQLNASFNQRMAAIGPYITDDDAKRLRSAWALMKTRDDYLKINEILERHAKNGTVNWTAPH